MTVTAAPFQLVVDSPVGVLVLEGGEASVTHLYLPNATPGPTPTEVEGVTARSTPSTSAAAGATASATAAGDVPASLEEAARQLDEYFAGQRRRFDLPLAPAGTAFQRSVWLALADIGYGETISYAELADQVGRPRAFRAVGQANGANPLPIFFPCHRVVASGGGLGGYGGGLDVKRRLLALEAEVNGSVTAVPAGWGIPAATS